MNATFKKAALALLVGAVAGTAWGTLPPAQSTIEIQAFAINNSILLELYNSANQTTQVINSYPSNMNPAVVQVTVKNPGTAAVTPCFKVAISEPAANCAGYAVTSPMLKSKKSVAPGETTVLNAADFEVSGNYDGQLCTGFEDEMKKEFEGMSPNDVNAIVQKFLKRKFTICVYEADPNSGAQVGSNKCTDFTLLQANPAATASCAILIYPHNNAVPDNNITFMWTPAQMSGVTAVEYVLEVSEDMGGDAIARVVVPGCNQNFYQWGAKDKALDAGKQYWWRVISRNCSTKVPFGGQDGKGWNVTKWFTIGSGSGAPKASGPCDATLEQLEAYVKQFGSPDVLALLKDMKLRGVRGLSLTDPDLCTMLYGTGVNRTNKVPTKDQLVQMEATRK